MHVGVKFFCKAVFWPHAFVANDGVEGNEVLSRFLPSWRWKDRGFS